MSWQSVIPANRKLLQLRLETLGHRARALEGCLCVTPSDRCNTAPCRRQEHHAALITCMPDGPCCPRSSTGQSCASDRLWHKPDRALAARSRKHWPSAPEQRVVAPGERWALLIADPAAAGTLLSPTVCARPRRWGHQQCSNASALAPHKVAIDRSGRRLPGNCRPALLSHHPCYQAGNSIPCKQEMPRLALQLTLPVASLAVRHCLRCRHPTKPCVGLVREPHRGERARSFSPISLDEEISSQIACGKCEAPLLFLSRQRRNNVPPGP